MKYFFYAVLTLSLAAQSLFAQTEKPFVVPARCSLSLAESPEINGFKLGRTAAQLEKSAGKKITPVAVPSGFFKRFETKYELNYFGIWVKTKTPIGQAEYSYFPNATEKSSLMSERVGGFELAFIDKVLAEYILYFSVKDFDIKAGQGLRAPVAEKFKLPDAALWRNTSDLNCRDFRISIDNYNPEMIRLRVIDVNLLKEITKRAEKAYAEEEKTKPQ